ncbi:hypothetical protein V8F33_004871 [Rhypophila sp. PSN 637]
MSTDLITYLNYMSTWDTESDDNIKRVIEEQELFTAMGDFQSDSVVDKEFKMLTDLAMEVRNHTIAADAAAVSAIWSFGLSMAAFAVLETTEMIEKSVISSKSKELNEKLKTIDTDIAAGINPSVSSYINKYKANNELISAKAPKGLDNRRCRAIFMQFMAHVHRSAGKLDVKSFKTYAESARKLFNSPEIEAVYAALDKLNLSGKADKDILEFINFLKGWSFPDQWAVSIVRTLSFGVMVYKLNIANEEIRVC